ncbi:hypothetical protein CEXT_258711 [Caerostris extrusa]|uniref:Uncharacterized protein n=1 Tax=Caerostris extrusa TaxID=172846 RepID=A0AAV4M4K8_CAEEX|nr:hypothetical protein CEXT_258711 [Caerostris extrusa]
MMMMMMINHCVGLLEETGGLSCHHRCRCQEYEPLSPLRVALAESNKQLKLQMTCWETASDLTGSRPMCTLWASVTSTPSCTTNPSQPSSTGCYWGAGYDAATECSSMPPRRRNKRTFKNSIRQHVCRDSNQPGAAEFRDHRVFAAAWCRTV